MDMSFANQALSAEYVIANAASLERKVYDVPKEIDDEIARLKLGTMGVAIDQLTRGAGRVPRELGRGDLREPWPPPAPRASVSLASLPRAQPGSGCDGSRMEPVLKDWSHDRSSGSRTTRSSSSTSAACPARRSTSAARRAAEVAEAIRTLAVRGAPAIGIAAAYGLALAAERGEDLDAASAVLAASRPTAVNLALGARRDA